MTPMKFTIGITRLAIIHTEIEVDAKTPEAAAKKALKQARDVGTLGWEVDDVYDDGKPHCVLSANTCTDQEGNEHEIEAELKP